MFLGRTNEARAELAALAELLPGAADYPLSEKQQAEFFGVLPHSSQAANRVLCGEWQWLGIHWFRLGEVGPAESAFNHSLFLARHIDWEAMIVQEYFLNMNDFCLRGCWIEQGRDIDFPMTLRAWVEEEISNKTRATWPDVVYIAALAHEVLGELERAQIYWPMLVDNCSGSGSFARYVAVARKKLAGHASGVRS